MSLSQACWLPATAVRLGDRLRVLSNAMAMSGGASMENPIPVSYTVPQAADAPAEGGGSWPPLPLDAWRDTYATLHLWTQIVGKVRLALAPPLNHWWAVTLYLDPRGLTTGSIPYGNDSFEVA